MKQINRRGFVKATGALVAAPALASLPGFAAQAPTTSDLRVDKDVVFGKGGDMDLLLDVYHRSRAFFLGQPSPVGARDTNGRRFSRFPAYHLSGSRL